MSKPVHVSFKRFSKERTKRKAAEAEVKRLRECIQSDSVKCSHCDEELARCQTCTRYFHNHPDCGIIDCEQCTATVCEMCSDHCWGCERTICPKCRKLCRDCGETTCDFCIEYDTHAH